MTKILYVYPTTPISLISSRKRGHHMFLNFQDNSIFVTNHFNNIPIILRQTYR